MLLSEIKLICCCHISLSEGEVQVHVVMDGKTALPLWIYGSIY